MKCGQVIIPVLAILAAPALAEGKQADKGPDQVVCRSDTVPNSRFTKKTCMTREQWARLTKESQSAYSELQAKVHTPPRSE